MTELYPNFSEIIWCVAGGDPVEVEDGPQYGASIFLYSEWSAHEWNAVNYPPGIRKYVKLQNVCKVEGQIYTIPQDSGDVVGAVIGIGNSLEEAQTMALANAAQVKAKGLHYNESCFDKSDEVLEKARKMKVGFE
jgi:hypothetical protein